MKQVWIEEGTKDLNELLAKIGDGQEVILVEPQAMDICLESFPCQGHKGVRVFLEGCKKILYDCSSPSIGIIIMHFEGTAPPHFQVYAQNLAVQKQGSKFVVVSTERGG